MFHMPTEVVTYGRTQHGLVTTPQLIEAGVSHYSRRRLVATGAVLEVHRNVYRFATAPDTLEQRCLAACLAVPDLAISGTCAGRLWQLRRMSSGPVHVMVKQRALDLDEVIVHRTNRLDPSLDVVTRADGIRVLSVPRLVFDLARFLDDDDLESVLEQVLHRRLADLAALFAASRRLRMIGRNGSARFGRVLARRPAWMKPAQSDHELRLLRALRRRGVELDPQHPVQLPDGSTVHLDGADPARRFGVEVDHITWHGGRLVGDYDKWRDRQLARIGWTVPRVPDSAIDRDLERTAAELAEIYFSRAVA